MLPLRALLSDVASESLSLDTRLFRTLHALLTRPGRLTNEYIAGHRAPYVTPSRLYLAISVIYFLVIALTGTRSFFFFTATEGNEQAGRFIALLPRLMFVILPGFALLLKVFYARRLYVEHLIFSLHYHAFAFLALSVHTLLEPIAMAALASEALPLWSIPILVLDLLMQLAVFVYLFLAMRRVYRQPRARTAVQMLGLLAGYLVMLILLGMAISQVVLFIARMQ